MNDEETRASNYRDDERRRRAARLALARTLAGNSAARRQLDENWAPLYLALLEMKGNWDADE